MRKKSNKPVCCSLLLIMFVLTECKNKSSEHQHPLEGVHTLNDTLVQTVSPSKLVLSDQTTITAQYGSAGDLMNAQGFISSDQDRNQSVAVRFGGRVEKLYVKFNNQAVKQGDKILDIYSPELRTYQEEHLFLLNSKSETSLLNKSREKLRLLGITERQIAQLEKNGSVALTISIFSPASGFVQFNNITSPDNANMSYAADMSGMATQQNTNKQSDNGTAASQIREGLYVEAGQTLFSINDFEKVWALVSVSGIYLNEVYKNQTVAVISESYPSKIYNGKVQLVEQTYEEAGQQFARIRIVLPNPDHSLKINSLITANFSAGKTKTLQIPASAVYKTGLNAYVWVKIDSTQKGKGIFQLRRITAGISNRGIITITNGLSVDELIAKEAGLMTDSETYLIAN